MRHVLLLALAGCATSVEQARVDADNDGFAAADDCDDHNATVFPHAIEHPHDGIDQDCDGADLVDADGDGSLDAVEDAAAGALVERIFDQRELLLEVADADGSGALEDAERRFVERLVRTWRGER